MPGRFAAQDRITQNRYTPSGADRYQTWAYGPAPAICRGGSCGHSLHGLGDSPQAARARGEAAIAAVRAAAGKGLGAYMANGPEGFARVFNPRLAGLGASTTVTGASSGASTGATVGTAILPGVGTAIGAVVGAVAGALFRSKKDPNAAEKEALKGALDKYMQVQGTIPGRAFDLLTLKQLIDGAGYRGMWPAVKKWSGDAISGAIDGCKGCTPPTIRDWVKARVAEGKIDPTTLVNEWTDHVNQTWGSKWFVASAGATQRQLIIDLLDFFVAQNKPDAPLFYAPEWTAAANTPPPAAAAPTPVPSGPTVTLPAPIVGTGVASPIPTQLDPSVAAMIQSALAQGASNMQAFQQAMQALQSQGVAATPAVQQQVAAQVQQAGAGGGLPSWATTGGLIAGVGLLILALARPKGSGRANRRR